MESVLDELYYAALEKGGNPFARKDNALEEKEKVTWEKLRVSLTAEQWNTFVAYVDLYGDRRDAEMQNAYQCGFKQGLVLAVESFYKTNR